MPRSILKVIQVEIAITEGIPRDSGFSGYVAFVIKVNSPVKITI